MNQKRLNSSIILSLGTLAVFLLSSGCTPGAKNNGGGGGGDGGGGMSSYSSGSTVTQESPASSDGGDGLGVSWSASSQTVTTESSAVVTVGLSELSAMLPREKFFELIALAHAAPGELNTKGVKLKFILSGNAKIDEDFSIEVNDDADDKGGIQESESETTAAPSFVSNSKSKSKREKLSKSVTRSVSLPKCKDSGKMSGDFNSGCKLELYINPGQLEYQFEIKALKDPALPKTLRLSVVDTGSDVQNAKWASASDSLLIQLNPGSTGEVTPGNQMPTVDAGPSQEIRVTAASAITLDGVVTDDGLPSPDGLHGEWDLVSAVEADGTDLLKKYRNVVPFEIVSGGDVLEDATDGPQSGGMVIKHSRPVVRIVRPGTYTLKFSATDGELWASDEVVLVVLPAEQIQVDLWGIRNTPARPYLNSPFKLSFRGSNTVSYPLENAFAYVCIHKSLRGITQFPSGSTADALFPCGRNREFALGPKKEQDFSMRGSLPKKRYVRSFTMSKLEVSSVITEPGEYVGWACVDLRDGTEYPKCISTEFAVFQAGGQTEGIDLALWDVGMLDGKWRTGKNRAVKFSVVNFGKVPAPNVTMDAQWMDQEGNVFPTPAFSSRASTVNPDPRPNNKSIKFSILPVSLTAPAVGSYTLRGCLRVDGVLTEDCLETDVLVSP